MKAAEKEEDQIMRWISSMKKEATGKTPRAEQGCVEDRTLWTSFI